MSVPVSICNHGTSQSHRTAPPARRDNKDPLAGMTLLNPDGLCPRPRPSSPPSRSPQALKRIRVAMAKEGVSPEQGGLRVGIQGGGCSGLSYNIKLRHPAPRARPHLHFGAASRPPATRPRPPSVSSSTPRAPLPPGMVSTSKRPSCARASTSSTPTPPRAAAAAQVSLRNLISTIIKTWKA